MDVTMEEVSDKICLRGEGFSVPKLTGMVARDLQQSTVER